MQKAFDKRCILRRGEKYKSLNKSGAEGQSVSPLSVPDCLSYYMPHRKSGMRRSFYFNAILVFEIFLHKKPYSVKILLHSY